MPLALSVLFISPYFCTAQAQTSLAATQSALCRSLSLKIKDKQKTLRQLEMEKDSSIFRNSKLFDRHLSRIVRLANKLGTLQSRYYQSCDSALLASETTSQLMYPSNLVQNNGFEQGTTAWTVSGESRAITSMSHSGLNSIELISSSSKSVEVRQTFSIYANNSYRIEAWAHAEHARPFAIYVKWFGPTRSTRRSENAGLLRIDTLSPNLTEATIGQWVLMQTVLQPPAGAVSSTLSLSVPKTTSGNIVHFDDATFTGMTIEGDLLVTPTPSLTASSTASPISIPAPSVTILSSPTATISLIPTSTRTRTPTFSATQTLLPNSTASATPSRTSTPISSATPSSTITLTPTALPTASATPSRTSTPTSLATVSATRTITSTPTSPPNNTASATPSRTNTATALPTAIATFTRTFTPTSLPVQSATATRTNTPPAVFTSTATRTHTFTPTSLPLSTATATASRTNTAISIATATHTRTYTATSQPISTASATPTRTATPTLTRTPTRTNTPSTGNGGLTVDFIATSYDCVAPCAVWFDASNTRHTSMSTSDVRLALDYNFDYRDTATPGDWSRGALHRNGTPQSKNIDRDTGVVGFHVYETPGTYYPQLTVNNTTVSTEIRVTNPDTHWPLDNTICFYTNSNNPPSPGTTPGCPRDAAVQLVTGINSLGDALRNYCGTEGPKRCLFRRGERYNLSDTQIIHAGDKYFGAYGTGAKPIWQDTATTLNNDFIGFDSGLSGFHFVDLDVRGKSNVLTEGSGVAFKAVDDIVIDRALWLRTDINRFDVAIYMHCNNYPSCDLDNDIVHHQIAFVDSTAQYGPGAVFDPADGHSKLELANIYITAKYFAMAGSISGDDLAGERPDDQSPFSGSSFNARFKWLKNAYVAHNEWGLLNDQYRDPDTQEVHEVIGCGHELSEANHNVGIRGGAIFSFRNGLNAGTRPDAFGNERDFPGENEIFVDNYVSACKYTQGSMGGFAQTDSSMQKVKERHIYSRMTGNFFTAQTSARAGASNSFVGHGKVNGLLMSNNVFDGTHFVENSTSASAIAVYGADSQLYACSGNRNFTCSVNNTPSEDPCHTTVNLLPTDPQYHGEIGPCEVNPLYHPPRDWRIFNNSYVVGPNSSNDSHDFWRNTVDAANGQRNEVRNTADIKFENNLFYDHDGTGQLPSEISEPVPGMTFCNGSLTDDSCNIRTTINPWIGSVPFSKIDDFKLINSLSPGANIGLWKQEVLRDILGRTRTSPTFAGAGGF